MVGLLLFLTIGSAVCIDLWNILDIRRGNSMVRLIPCVIRNEFDHSSQKHVAKHFFARAFALILIPAIVYMLFFWIHFKILSHSGTGDEFMSPQFQETLIGSPLTVDSEGLSSHLTPIMAR